MSFTVLKGTCTTVIDETGIKAEVESTDVVTEVIESRVTTKVHQEECED